MLPRSTGNQFHFDLCSEREPGDRDRRACRVRTRKAALVGRVHCGKIRHGCEVNIALDDVVHGESRVLENQGEVVKRAHGLRINVAVNQLACGGIDWGLAREVEEFPRPDGVRIRTDGGWAMRTCYGVSRHYAVYAAAPRPRGAITIMYPQRGRRPNERDRENHHLKNTQTSPPNARVLGCPYGVDSKGTETARVMTSCSTLR